MRRLQLLFPLLLIITLSACIAFPVGFGDEEPFKDKQLTFIQVGKSTKEEIATAMSQFASTKTTKPKMFRDGDWWLYAATREETKWLILSEGGMAGTGDVDYRFLLIKFDTKGIVSGYELSKSEGNGCNRNGVCTGLSQYMLLASEDEDRVVKQFDISADRCGVYVYGRRRYEVPVWLDGYPVGWLLDKKQFFFWQLDQGVHQLAPHGPDDSFQLSIEFSCVAGYVYFFELTPKQGGIEIEHRDAVLERKAIGKRHLTLSMSEQR